VATGPLAAGPGRPKVGAFPIVSGKANLVTDLTSAAPPDMTAISDRLTRLDREGRTAVTRTEIGVKSSPVASGAYSQGVAANKLLFVDEVGPYDPVTRAVVGTTVEEQTIQTMENIRAILLGAGLDLEDVVNSTVYLAELQRDWTAFDKAYGSFLASPFPARAKRRRDSQRHPR
jgi:2-iminobutanoate/2-iminopropanoate deaminase